MMQPFENRTDSFFDHCVTRRDCLRYLMRGWGLGLTMPLFIAKAAAKTTGASILDKYLGEELSYQIGFWLIGHCGDAKTGFFLTDVPDIYRISLEGHGIGFINSLLGGVTYSYTSFCRYLSDQDRLQPVYFELKKRRGSRVSLRSARFNHGAKEIEFIRTESSGKTQMDREPMKTDRIYEDYLTLFYNFRHGYYGPLQRNRQYQLPLYTQKQMHPVKLQIVDFETEKKYRSQEFNRADKDFFIRFQINPEDVSSGSGEIIGWLSSDATPMKGTIQDVVFFGDLWGDLIRKQVVKPDQKVKVPAAVKNLF
jgi:hypothetical protein